jgi:hypothetical protein
LETFLRQNTAQFTYNRHQLQHITSDVCGQYVCLYTAYICAKHYNMKSFVATFNSTDADSQALQMFQHEFGSPTPRCGHGQTCLQGIKVSTSLLTSSVLE